MCQQLSFKDLVCITLLLDEEENKRSKRNRIWVHEMLLKRKTECEFATLYRELIDYEMKFYIYFRMSIQQFSILLSKIQWDLTKQNTTFREAVTQKEKLAFCLRLATYFILLKQNNLVIIIKREQKRR